MAAPTVVAVTAARIDVAWNAALDDWGVAGYRVLRDGVPLAETVALLHSDASARPATRYCYAVVALDTGGHASVPGPAACVTTPADLAAPGVPTGLSVQAGDTTATLRWN